MLWVSEVSSVLVSSADGWQRPSPTEQAIPRANQLHQIPPMAVVLSWTRVDPKFCKGSMALIHLVRVLPIGFSSHILFDEKQNMRTLHFFLPFFNLFLVRFFTSLQRVLHDWHLGPFTRPLSVSIRSIHIPWGSKTVVHFAASISHIQSLHTPRDTHAVHAASTNPIDAMTVR